MKKATIITLITGLIFTAPAYALDLGHDSNEDLKTDRERSTSTKQTDEQKDSQGTKTSKTKATSRDKTKTKSYKDTAQAMQSGSLDLSITPDIVFLKRLKEMEKSGVEPFATCQVLSHPKLAKDFGLSAEISPGTIDTIMSSLLSQSASSNADIKSVNGDDAGIKAYQKCLAVYGSMIREGFFLLNNRLPQVAKIEKKLNQEVAVKGIGFHDFENIARDTINEIVANQDKHSHKYDYLFDNDATCRFEGKTDAIQCGGLMIQLGTKPTLVSGTVSIYGSGGYGGMSGAYKLSSSYSLSQALEDVAADATSEKFSREWQAYADSLEAKGQSLEAAKVRRKAISLAAQNKFSLSPSKFFPGQ